MGTGVLFRDAYQRLKSGGRQVELVGFDIESRISYWAITENYYRRVRVRRPPACHMSQVSISSCHDVAQNETKSRTKLQHKAQKLSRKTVSFA